MHSRIFLGVILSAFLGELTLYYLDETRYTSPIINLPIKERNRQFSSLDPVLGTRLLPHKEISAMSANSQGEMEFISDSGIFTDNMGFINFVSPEEVTDYQKLTSNPEVFRVLISGSSTAMGLGVRDKSDAWVSILTKYLKEQVLSSGAFERVVILNSAFFPQNISSAARRFADETIFLNPNLVIHYDDDYLVVESENVVDLSASRRDMVIRRILNEQPYETILFPYLVKHILYPKRAKRSQEFYYRSGHYISSDRIRYWYDRVLDIYATAKVKGVPFLYVMAPNLNSCGKPPTARELQLNAKFFRNELFMPWYNLKDTAADTALRRRLKLKSDWQLDLSCLFQFEKDDIFSDPLHLNRTGNRRVAKEIIRHLEKIGYLSILSTER